VYFWYNKHPNCNIEVCNLHLGPPVITTNVNAELLYYIIGFVSSFVQSPVVPYGSPIDQGLLVATEISAGDQVSSFPFRQSFG